MGNPDGQGGVFMGFQDDWMLRQIEMITRHVAMMIFHKRAVRYELSSSEMLSETDELHLKLDGLIREGKLCEAEDLLFDNLMFTDRYIELAVDFYTRLNQLTDQELENGGFTRDEVYDGYVEILMLLGVPIDEFVA